MEVGSRSSSLRRNSVNLLLDFCYLLFVIYCANVISNFDPEMLWRIALKKFVCYFCRRGGYWNEAARDA